MDFEFAEHRKVRARGRPNACRRVSHARAVCVGLHQPRVQSGRRTRSRDAAHLQKVLAEKGRVHTPCVLRCESHARVVWVSSCVRVLLSGFAAAQPGLQWRGCAALQKHHEVWPVLLVIRRIMRLVHVCACWT